MPEPRVVILGGGPAGVGAAWKLAREHRAEVVLLEQGQAFGGNAGSFSMAGQELDYGSHRLHPSCDPEILDDIRAMLGQDLLDRPRHGRIRLCDKWIHFPLKPMDLFLRLDRRFAMGTVRDMLSRTGAPADSATDTFASVLHANLGPTICRHFYFPYAVKLWGLAPDELSGIQARLRVSAGTFGKLCRKVMNQVPGFKKPGSGRFFYPRRGYGQISDAYAQAARKAGADLRLGHKVTRIERGAGSAGTWRVHAEGNGGVETRFDADFVWSTIPITILARAMHPPPSDEVSEAASSIDYRSMILIYAQLRADRFTEYDAHYFPDGTARITRLSEPKIYADRSDLPGTTVICAELPCSMSDPWWTMNDEELGRLLAQDLERAGLPLPGPPAAIAVRRLRQAYPVYRLGYESAFSVLDRWVASQPHLLSYGRQGLFAHDNTHHALFMAYRAAECLENGRFDEERWAGSRKVFQGHVVED